MLNIQIAQPTTYVASVPSSVGSVESLVHADHILIIFITMNCPLTYYLSATHWWQKVAVNLSLLLDIAVEEQDKFSSQICSRCANRVESLVKAVNDLVALKDATWIESQNKRNKR